MTENAQKELDALLGTVRAWVVTGIGPTLMSVSLPTLGVSVTFRGKKIIIQAKAE